MKQTMLNIQKQRVAQLELKYEVVTEELKRQFEMNVRYGVEQQYRQYLSAAQYINGAIETKTAELRKIESDHSNISKKSEEKRAVNRKMIDLLKSLSADDENSSDAVTEMVNKIIEQLKDDSFIPAIFPEDIIPFLR